MKQIIRRLVNKINQVCGYLPDDLIAIVARFGIAVVFWRSVQTKIVGWTFFDQSFQFYNLNQSTIMLFRYEFNVPLLSYTSAAYLATFAEFFLSITLVLGFATRLSAVGLLGVTAVLQFFVFPDAWPIHILWVTGLLYLIKHGAGRVSLDKLLNW